ncbi:MAG TPA: ABC transporter permease [candidate division Zixibacteria bacterium]|nr:ABC transporter permease [candidate division Zixibacteria bacterium]
MDFIVDGIKQALELLLSLEPEVLQITLLSLRLSGIATAISLVLGLPIGTMLALGRFRGRRLWLSLANTGMALPPVVVGLVVALMLWRSGPFGSLGIMYSPAAIVIAQLIIATPIIIALTVASLQQLDPALQLQLLGLGASRMQMVWILWKEARMPLLAALMAAFGAAISEVGAVMMVGGNLRGHTRVLTSAIVLETGRGEFAPAIALGVILLLLAFTINLGLTLIQQRKVKR